MKSFIRVTCVLCTDTNIVVVEGWPFFHRAKKCSKLAEPMPGMYYSLHPFSFSGTFFCFLLQGSYSYSKINRGKFGRGNMDTRTSVRRDAWCIQFYLYLGWLPFATKHLNFRFTTFGWYCSFHWISFGMKTLISPLISIPTKYRNIIPVLRSSSDLQKFSITWDSSLICN